MGPALTVVEAVGQAVRGAESKFHLICICHDVPFSYASILASEVDLVVQVIQYRRYPQQMTIRAKQLIEKVGGNFVGLVLNNINMSQDESYYYYTGYYNDYYSRNEDEAAAPVSPKGSSGDSDKSDITQKY